MSRRDQICGRVIRLIIRQDDRRYRTIRLHHGFVTISIGVGLAVTLVSHLRAQQHGDQRCSRGEIEAIEPDYSQILPTTVSDIEVH